jgi:branched-chain amino acid transport system ATP-binding protein
MSLLRVEGLSVRFGGVRAVDNVTFEVRPGEVFTIIGPNGAGKTTIFNAISRLCPVTSGRLVFKEWDITDVPPHAIGRLGIARTFQNIELFERATVLQNLLLGRHVHRRTGLLAEMLFLPQVRRSERAQRERVEEIIDFLGLQRYRDIMVMSLPFGLRKVVELGRACAMEPTLLLLDEPSSGLNVEETDDVAAWIQDIRSLRGITVLMVEHDMRLVSAASDRVLALNYGQVLATGAPHEVQHHPEVVKAYLGGESDGK